jgi:RNA polymerase sigma-70 factor (ECF subfamily)
MPADDLDLVWRLRDGDESAFDELMRRYQRKVYGLCYRFVRNHDDAADLTQEAFVRAYRAVGRFRGDARLYTWLYRITVNICISHLRRRERERSQPIENCSVHSTPDPAVQAELKQAIEAAVRRLPEQQRAVFILRHYEGLSFREVSQVMGRSEGGAKANYFHALTRVERKFHAERERLRGEMFSLLTVEQQARFLVFQEQFERELRDIIREARRGEHPPRPPGQ